MHVGIAAPAPFPERTIFAREQAAALSSLGHDVTVFAPLETQSGWPIENGVVVRDVSWITEPRRFATELENSNVDVLHAHALRGNATVPAVSIPMVVELLSVSLRPAPVRQIVSLWTTLRLKGRFPVGCANPALVGPTRPATFFAPNGYSSWALEVAARRSPHRHLCVYQGTTSPLRRLELLVESFANVASHREDVALVFVGGPATEALESAIADHDLAPRVAIRPSRGPGPLVDAMSRASLTLVWVPNERGFDDQPPLKLLDALAADVPALATGTTANRELLSRGGGLTASPEVGSFSDVWLEMIEAIEEGVPFAKEDRKTFLRERSWRHIIEHYWLPAYRSVLRS